MFSIRTMELIPIAMEQQPNIMLILSLKSPESLSPTNAPITPPITMDSELMIIPIGISVPPSFV
jgi:hypothetical protein